MKTKKKIIFTPLSTKESFEAKNIKIADVILDSLTYSPPPQPRAY